MKRPKLPENPNFWLQVARDKKMVNEFMERGNDRQKSNLKKALKLAKWHKIQTKKEESER